MQKLLVDYNPDDDFWIVLVCWATYFINVIVAIKILQTF